MTRTGLHGLVARSAKSALSRETSWPLIAQNLTVRGGTNERATTVEGTPIAYREWGDPADRSIVLVHGGAAHSRWWDHIAPLLTGGWRVVALDLSGHGDSGRRDRYSLDAWAREMCSRSSPRPGMPPPAWSSGTAWAAWSRCGWPAWPGPRIAGAVAIDCPVRDMAPEDRAAREHRAFGPLRVSDPGGGRGPFPPDP